MAINVKNATVASVVDKTTRLVFELEITSNATPADKEHASDLPGVAFLRTEGKVTEADALEDLSASFTTAADNAAGDSQFGIIIDGSELTNDRSIEKVYSVSLAEKTSLAASVAVSKVGGSFLSPEGNLAFDVAGTGLNLASESPKFVLTVEFKEA